MHELILNNPGLNFWNMLFVLKILYKKISDEKPSSNFEKNIAPGEARTHNLGLTQQVSVYKIRALTDCATGALVTNSLPSLNYA